MLGAPREECPSTLTTEKMANTARVILLKDCRIPLLQLAQHLSISYDSVQSIVNEQFEMHRVCYRWIPRLIGGFKEIVFKWFHVRLQNIGD